MFRSVLPNILVSLGYVMILLALGSSIPLFEWKTDELVTDFPPTYQVRVSSSPITTNFGEALKDSSYYGRIYVLHGGTICNLADVNFNARLLYSRSALERASLKYFTDENTMRLIEWVVGELILSVIYIWLFMIWYKRPFWEAIVFSIGFTVLVLY
jgi:hypothetical protein